jgi:Domain of unknown function (DUF6471)
MFFFSIKWLLTSIGVDMDQDKPYWAKIVSKILKTELAKRDMGYSELVERLKSLDVHVKVEDVRGRVSRGNFSAMLFVQCLRAIGVKNLQLEDSFFETKEDK